MMHSRSFPGAGTAGSERRDGWGAGAAPGALAWARTRVFEAYVLIWSLMFGAAIMTVFKLWRTPRLVRWILWLWTRGFVLGAWVILGVRYRLEGLGNIPAGRPVIFACNHQSYWESIFLCSRIRDVNVVTKRGAMDIPVFGWGLKHAPMIPVDRDQPGRNLRRILRDGPASLAAGRDLLIFPEGTRVPPGQRRPYLRGVELLYRKCGVAVVPIVQNAGLLWPPGFGVKRPGTVTVRFLEPIPPGLEAAEFAERLERLLNAEKDRLPGMSPASAEQPVAEPAPAPALERRAARAG